MRNLGLVNLSLNRAMGTPEVTCSPLSNALPNFLLYTVEWSLSSMMDRWTKQV